MENTDQLLDYSIPQLLRWRVKISGDKVALRERISVFGIVIPGMPIMSM